MFSITTFYWGNLKNLESFVDHCNMFTDDIVIINIDLFGKYSDVKNANVINVDARYLLDNGHSDILMLADRNSVYDWTYSLAVGKRIISFNQELLRNADSDIAGFRCTNLEKSGSWQKFRHKDRSSWIKTVHETVLPNEGYRISTDNVLIWDRLQSSHDLSKQYEFMSKEEETICKGYRQLSRIKWVALENMDPHPKKDYAIEMYEKHKSAYEMDKDNLVDYLLANDLQAGM